MRIGASISSTGDSQQAIERIIEEAAAPLAGARPDWGLFFAANHFEDEFASAAAEIRKRTGVRTLIGSTGEGIIGSSAEVERQPAMSLWLTEMPRTEVRPFRIDQADLEVIDSPEAFARLVSVRPDEQSTLIVLADPFSFHISAFLDAVNECLPGTPVVGGMASGVEAPQQAVLVHNDEHQREGAVGVALVGPAPVAAVVSQGCRPIGDPFVITAAEENIVKQLGGRPALSMLNRVFAGADAEEKRLMQQGIFVGQVINECKERFGRGDFLVRNLLGADQKSGALAIGDFARVGRTIQFHVRDAKSADEDLRAMLDAQREPPPVGALLFTCNGRGTRLFPQPSHDLLTLHEIFGPIPTAGLFCAGELGPIGGRNFIHGHTASVALFRPEPAPAE